MSKEAHLYLKLRDNLIILSGQNVINFIHKNMKVLVSKIVLVIPFSNSLKDKRRVVKSLKDRIWSKFRASIAEIDEHDTIRKAVLGITCVSKDKHILDSMINGIIDLIDTTYPGILHECEHHVENY